MIIKDLGMMYPEKSTLNKRKRRFCLVSCSGDGCNNTYKTETSLYKHKDNGKFCVECQKKRKKEKSTTHGKSKNNSYKRWTNIKSRCYSPKHLSYHRYGARNIGMCEEWINDYLSFEKYISSLDNAYMGTRSIDRINNNGNYEPGNLRWASKKTQSDNQEKNYDTGVTFHNTHKKYRCCVIINGKQKSLGMFNHQKDAMITRNKYIIDNNIIDKNTLNTRRN